jgi:ribosomal protein S18 acetylase RimI-like enzyme
MDMAAEKRLDYIWLGVWEHNYNARGFYEHNGFKVFGSHEFLLGDDRQTDLLMKKSLK